MTAPQQKQQFILPNMPFNRDINNGCPIGSSIQLTAKPYQDKNKFAQLRLITNNSDVALRINLELGPSAKIKIDCTVSQKTSTNIENSVSLPFQQTFILAVRTLQHSFQIFINGSKIADFVHRVDPTLIRSLSIEGPLICDEVVVDPNSAALPSYTQATSPPTDLLRNMNLSESTTIPSAPHDLPPPPPNVLAAGNGAIPSAPPGPSNPNTGAAPFFYSGGSQGFSNHPYPLPGMMDLNTYPSQQNQANPLPQKTSVPVSTQAVPINVHTTTTTNATNANTQPRPPYPTTEASNVMSPTVVHPQPYTVTFPQSQPGTPIHPYAQPPQPQAQPPRYPPQQQQAFYQNQPYPPQQPMQMPAPIQPNIGMGVTPTQMPPIIQPNIGMGVTPGQMPPPIQPVMSVQPFIPPPAVPPTYIYPTVTPYVQPTVYPYPQSYYQPGMVFYEQEYYPHHHHHHRHHHHC